MASPAASLSLQKRTFGEQLLGKLVSKLPKKAYFALEQVQLIDRDGLSWQPDMVIVCAHLGVLVVEIKDWSAIVEADRETVTIRKRDGAPLTLPNPVSQAQNYAHVLAQMFQEREELLVERNGMRRLAFPWQYAIALPYLSQRVIQQMETAHIWQPGIVFGQETLKQPESFERAIRALPWRFKLTAPMNNDTLDVIRGTLCPSLRIITPDGDDVGTETRTQSQLITEPLPTVALPGMATEDDAHVRLVRGVAGSGKSLILIRRALHLRETYPDLRLLVLSYNRDLADDLQRRIGRDDIDVMNFHQLCARIMGRLSALDNNKRLEQIFSKEVKASGFPLDFVAEEIAWRKDNALFDEAAYLEMARVGRGIRLSRDQRETMNALFSAYHADQVARRAADQPWADWEDFPLVALEHLAEPDHPLRYAYDAILIDEAQDFAPIWFAVIRKVLKPGGHLFICDDPTQSVFRSYTWKQKGINVVGRSTILRIPFRSTRQISEAAHALIAADPNLQGSDDITTPNYDSYTLASGSLPALVACETVSAEAKLVTAEGQKLLDAGVEPTTIGILCAGRWRTKQWADLKAKGVYVDNFWKMKGLEFQAVFLPHLQDLFREGDEDVDPFYRTEQRRKLFTAMTRAQQTVVMTYSGPQPEPLAVLEPFVEMVTV